MGGHWPRKQLFERGQDTKELFSIKQTLNDSDGDYTEVKMSPKNNISAQPLKKALHKTPEVQ